MTPEKERKTKMAFERIQYHALRQNLMKGIQKYFLQAEEDSKNKSWY